jgi:hypothetical protein
VYIILQYPPLGSAILECTAVKEIVEYGSCKCMNPLACVYSFSNQGELACESACLLLRHSLLGRQKEFVGYNLMCQSMEEFQRLFMQLHRMPSSQVPEILLDNVIAEVKMGLIRLHQQTNKLNTSALLYKTSKSRNCSMPLYSGLLGVE